jgi:RNA polymerase sigma-70 factor (ECF subfamily)
VVTSRIDAALEAGRAAWPGVDVDVAGFGAYLEARADATALGDLYLTYAASTGDPRALAVLDKVLAEEAAAAAGAARADASTRDEATQIVRTLLLVPRAERPPAILDFAGRGPLRGWLRVTATREVIRLGKRGAREVELAEHVLEAQALGDDPALAVLKERYRDALGDAFRDALGGLGARERTLLRYQLVDQLSIDDLGAIYQVHRATAARWLQKIRDELVERTHAALAERLSLDPAEVPSIVRLVQSQLDVSVITHLK